MSQTTGVRAMAIGIVVLIALCCGDDHSAVLSDLSHSAIADRTCHVVGYGTGEAVVLLGHLHFADEGRRHFRTGGAATPGRDSGIGGLAGHQHPHRAYHGDQAVLRIAFANSPRFPGLIVEGVRDGMLAGQLALLPDNSLRVRFEARERN